MLQNAYFLAKIGADTAENEQHFAEILPTEALDAVVPHLAAFAQVPPAGGLRSNFHLCLQLAVSRMCGHF